MILLNSTRYGSPASPGQAFAFSETWGHFASGELATVIAGAYTPQTAPAIAGATIVNGVNQVNAIAGLAAQYLGAWVNNADLAYVRTKPRTLKVKGVTIGRDLAANFGGFIVGMDCVAAGSGTVIKVLSQASGVVGVEAWNHLNGGALLQHVNTTLPCGATPYDLAASIDAGGTLNVALGGTTWINNLATANGFGFRFGFGLMVGITGVNETVSWGPASIATG